MAESIPRMQPSDSTASMVTALGESGALIVGGLLSDGILSRFNAEIDDYLETADDDRQLVNPLIGAFFGPHTRHITGVAAEVYRDRGYIKIMVAAVGLYS